MNKMLPAAIVVLAAFGIWTSIVGSSIDDYRNKITKNKEFARSDSFECVVRKNNTEEMIFKCKGN